MLVRGMTGAISIVVTTRRDREGLAELLPALAARGSQPAEGKIVDAGQNEGRG
jgi:hypothetical protein